MVDGNQSRPVPYPVDVRAKGWRFELDHERIRQSDTWALAPPEVRPWLLMLWMTAWEQAPCGSLPAGDELIAARIGMSLKLFVKHRACLMRGWWTAEDGRLYHNTLTERVLEMVAAKGKERQRKAEYRARNSERTSANRVPRLSHGTTMGQPRDSHGSPSGRDDTGTGTGTMNTPPYPPQAGGGGGGESAESTKAEAICRAVEAMGITGANPGDLTLQALIDKGVQVGAFEAAAALTLKAGTAVKHWSYLLAIIRRQVGDAAQIAAGPALQQGAWDATRSSIEAMGLSLGIGRWNEADLSASRETFEAYTQRVRRCVEAPLVSA